MNLHVSRLALVALAMLWSGYAVVLGVVTLEMHANRTVAILALIAYAAAVVLALLGTRRWVQIPMSLAIATAALALASVLLGMSGLDPAKPLGYATWFVGGYGVVMTIVMTRQRPAVAWTSLIALVAILGTWAGPLGMIGMGVLGPFSWVLVAQLIFIGLRNAARDASVLAAAEQEASNWQAMQEAMAAERVQRLQGAERRARPMLEQIVASGGDLPPALREESRRLEAALRDEVRGRGLLDDRVRDAVAALRDAGTKVMLLDEGGLDDVAAEERQQILDQLAALLADVEADYVTVRTSPSQGPRVTVIGVKGDMDDEDGDVEVTMRQGLGSHAESADKDDSEDPEDESGDSSGD